MDRRSVPIQEDRVARPDGRSGGYTPQGSLRRLSCGDRIRRPLPSLTSTDQTAASTIRTSYASADQPSRDSDGSVRTTRERTPRSVPKTHPDAFVLIPIILTEPDDPADRHRR